MNNRGFTLIEILLTSFILVLVITSTVKSFIAYNQTQRKVLASQEMAENAQYALEYISKALRMAQKSDGVVCSDIPANYTYKIHPTYSTAGIKFQNYRSECQEFYKKADGIIYQKIGLEELPLTSSKIETTYLTFSLIGENPAPIDTLQSRVTIVTGFRGKGAKEEQKAEVKLQTTISLRDIE